MPSAQPASRELSTELLPFAEVLHEPAWARTATRTLRWLVERSDANFQAERRLPVLVTVASVYACSCAPQLSSERHYDVVARFTLLFFLVDDAEQGELPDLSTAEASWSIGRYTPALRAWLAELSEQATPPARLSQSFARAYHDYLAARRAEHGHRARPLGLQQHWAFRRRSIFMDPYLDLWMMLLGIDPDAVLEPPFLEARALAVDLVLLANDLGSVERDQLGGASPDDLNLIHAFAREHGVTESEALERLIVQYNQLIERYRAASTNALSSRPGPSAERYADLLTSVVEGNVASMRALGFRYPGAEHVLVRLPSARASQGL
jgi:hypothetical protein